jgi:hypothetical protein
VAGERSRLRRFREGKAVANGTPLFLGFSRENAPLPLPACWGPARPDLGRRIFESLCHVRGGWVLAL